MPPSWRARPRRDGRELVAALGGDGTVNEVVNGLARERRGGPELAILPVRHRARHHPHLRHPQAAEARARAAARTARTRTIDLGRATFRAAAGEGSRWYINIGSCGLTGAVAERAERTSKRLGGTPSFLYATVARSRPGATSRSACRSTTSRRSSSSPTT